MVTPKSRYKLNFIAPTCHHYQVPLFRRLASHPRIDLMVHFCSDEALHGQDILKMYKTESSWGDEAELLEGYPHKFLRNYSPWPSYIKGFYGLLNLGVWGEIKKNKPDVVVLMSWANPTWWLAVLACLRFRIPFMYMTDMNIQNELLKRPFKRWLKRVFLGQMLFRLASGFLCAGTANADLFRYYGVPERKLIPFAYNWGYEPLIELSTELNPQKNQIRAELGISQHSKVILYTGRMSREKSPLDLLKAYELADVPGKALVFVGDGPLKGQLEDYVANNNLESVHFTSFQSPQDVPKYYAMADVLVLPSHRETWGIVVSEAMCFGKPVIVSEQVGAVADLVQDSYNGFRFPRGDVGALAGHIQRFFELPDEERSAMGSRSQELIRSWVARDVADTLDQRFDLILSKTANARDV